MLIDQRQMLYQRRHEAMFPDILCAPPPHTQPTMWHTPMSCRSTRTSSSPAIMGLLQRRTRPVMGVGILKNTHSHRDTHWVVLHLRCSPPSSSMHSFVCSWLCTTVHTWLNGGYCFAEVPGVGKREKRRDIARALHIRCVGHDGTLL